MGFEEKDKTKKENKSLGSMTLWDIENTLPSVAQVCMFNASGASERMSKNYRYLGRWAAMSAEEYRAQCVAAKSAGKTIEVYSGAYLEDGSVRMPVDDSDRYIKPCLSEIIDLQRERIRRIDYAKQMEIEELDRQALARGMHA